MSYASLAEKIKLLPEEYLDEIDDFIEKLLIEFRNKTKTEKDDMVNKTNDSIKGKRQLGIANGKYDIPENI